MEEPCRVDNSHPFKQRKEKPYGQHDHCGRSYRPDRHGPVGSLGSVPRKGIQGAELRLRRRRPLDRPHGARAVPAQPIFASQPIPGEKIIGWIAHYALGAAFGFLPILLGGGAGWIANPTWLAAIGAGLLTLAVPFFIVVPAFGMGVLCARAPDPWAARRQGVIAHLYYGVALYIAAVLVAMLMR